MKLRKVSKSDIAHLRFFVFPDKEQHLLRVDESNLVFTLMIPDVCKSDPPFVKRSLLDDGYSFSHAIFHRYSDGRLDVEYVYYQNDLSGIPEDNIVLPQVADMLLEKQIQSLCFRGYFNMFFKFLQMIQRYE